MERFGALVLSFTKWCLCQKHKCFLRISAAMCNVLLFHKFCSKTKTKNMNCACDRRCVFHEIELLFFVQTNKKVAFNGRVSQRFFF